MILEGKDNGFFEFTLHFLLSSCSSASLLFVKGEISKLYTSGSKYMLLCLWRTEICLCHDRFDCAELYNCIIDRPQQTNG